MVDTVDNDSNNLAKLKLHLRQLQAMKASFPSRHLLKLKSTFESSSFLFSNLALSSSCLFFSSLSNLLHLPLHLHHLPLLLGLDQFVFHGGDEGDEDGGGGGRGGGGGAEVAEVALR